MCVVVKETTPVCPLTEMTAFVGVAIFVMSASIVGLSSVTIQLSHPPVDTVNQSPRCDACTHASARAAVVSAKFPRYSEMASDPSCADGMKPEASRVATPLIAHFSDRSIFKSSADCVAVLTGLLASLVLSTFQSPTAVLSSVCHDLSPLQYCEIVPAVIVPSFPDKAVVRPVMSATA